MSNRLGSVEIRLLLLCRRTSNPKHHLSNGLVSSRSHVSEMGLVARRAHSPPFSRRGGCAINKKIPFRSGADGVVSKFQQNKVRYADIYIETTRPFTSHVVCAFQERDLFIEAQPPLLENGG